MTRFLLFLLVSFFYTNSLSSQDFITYNFNSVDGGQGYSAIADMDGDGNIDIVTNPVNRIIIYHHDGTLPIDLKYVSIVPCSRKFATCASFPSMHKTFNTYLAQILYFMIQYIALNPSFQLIFLPSA